MLLTSKYKKNSEGKTKLRIESSRKDSSISILQGFKNDSHVEGAPKAKMWTLWAKETIIIIMIFNPYIKIEIYESMQI